MSSEFYRKAGVDLASADSAKKRIAKLARETFSESVVGDIGAFGGVFRFPQDSNRLLVASADGVGTKIKIAIAMGIYNTVGQDLVNHCVNDIAALGAKPLFFLDYIGHSNLSPKIIAEIVEGLSIACKKNNLSLIGGETAQMPGTYADGDFDLVGFIVGEARSEELIDGSRIAEGDVIVTILSNGLQTNGYSLARRVLLDNTNERLFEKPEMLNGSTIAEALLEIHPCYLPALEGLRAEGIKPHGLAHITGGGIAGNLVRVLPKGKEAIVKTAEIPIPPIFELISQKGKIPKDEMFEVFNMGAGFMLVLAPEDVNSSTRIIEKKGFACVRCGEIVDGERGVKLI